MKRTGRHAGGEAGWDGPVASEAVAGSDTYLAQSANLPSQARLAARQLTQATLGRPRFVFSGGMDVNPAHFAVGAEHYDKKGDYRSFWGTYYKHRKRYVESASRKTMNYLKNVVSQQIVPVCKPP